VSIVGNWLVVVLIAGLLVLPAANAWAEAAGAQAAQDVEIVEIVLTEYAFGPSEVAMAPGTFQLRLVNAGIRRHNLIVQVDGVERVSPEVRPGDVVAWDVPIEQTGRYLFWCGEYRHLEKGMVGTLLVE
jgi:plastocyanin